MAKLRAMGGKHGAERAETRYASQRSHAAEAGHTGCHGWLSSLLPAAPPQLRPSLPARRCRPLPACLRSTPRIGSPRFSASARRISSMAAAQSVFCAGASARAREGFERAVRWARLRRSAAERRRTSDTAAQQLVFCNGASLYCNGASLYYNRASLYYNRAICTATGRVWGRAASRARPAQGAAAEEARHAAAAAAAARGWAARTVLLTWHALPAVTVPSFLK